jgi:hypothetical protein
VNKGDSVNSVVRFHRDQAPQDGAEGDLREAQAGVGGGSFRVRMGAKGGEGQAAGGRQAAGAQQAGGSRRRQLEQAASHVLADALSLLVQNGPLGLRPLLVVCPLLGPQRAQVRLKLRVRRRSLLRGCRRGAGEVYGIRYTLHTYTVESPRTADRETINFGQKRGSIIKYFRPKQA